MAFASRNKECKRAQIQILSNLLKTAGESTERQPLEYSKGFYFSRRRQRFGASETRRRHFAFYRAKAGFIRALFRKHVKTRAVQ